MKFVNRLMCLAFGAMLLSPLIAAFADPAQQGTESHAAKTDLPPGEGKDLLVKQCTGCHQLTMVTTQHKSESGWTDTVIEMRNRGANGSDEDMEKIVRYLTANFGSQGAPAKVNVNSAQASDMVSGLSLSQVEADAVVTYRNKNGKFKDIAGLKQVPGVDAAKIDAMKDKIDF
jgi:competence protein ComEA